MWLRAPDELTGRPFWIIGLASLAMASALHGNPAGATAWGVALILAGGMVFLASAQQIWLNRILLVGAWTIIFPAIFPDCFRHAKQLWIVRLFFAVFYYCPGFLDHGIYSPRTAHFNTVFL